jgi:large subunit ribosomal protein L7/L12
MAEEAKTEAAEAAVEEVKTEVPEKFAKIVAELDKMSVLDLSEFVKTLEDHYGVSAAAPVAMAAAPAAGGEAAAADEKSSFNIYLAATGDKKIDVIKAVREITGLGLAESKGVVDGAPTMVKEDATKDEAEDAKGKLEAAGATVELQ